MGADYLHIVMLDTRWHHFSFPFVSFFFLFFLSPKKICLISNLLQVFCRRWGGVGGWLFHDLIYFWKSKYVSDGSPPLPFQKLDRVGQGLESSASFPFL